MWTLVLMIARTYYDCDDSTFEYEIEGEHEKDNVICHDLINYFGFCYEFECKLCDQLRSGTYDEVSSISSDE